jgi:hypothetical protein
MPQFKAFIDLAVRRVKVQTHAEFSSRLIAARGSKEQVKDFYKGLKVDN